MKFRFAIHAHVFYPELWPELANCIKNFENHDIALYVTTPHAGDDIRERIFAEFPFANYRVLENRGYDVGPFMEVLNSLDLSNYDFIVKLHTKRDWDGWFNSMYVHGGKWRNWLLDFCKTKENLERTLSVFNTNFDVGAVANPNVIVTHGDYLEKESVKERAKLLIEKIGLPSATRCFIGGTMFICRATLLKPLQNSCVLSDFSPVKKHELATLAHVYERALGYIITAQGKTIVASIRTYTVFPHLWFITVPIYNILLFLRNQMPDRRRQRHHG